MPKTSGTPGQIAEPDTPAAPGKTATPGAPAASRTIAVFGAGSGLGASVARRFGREGYRVALVARRRGPLEALRAELAAEGIEAEVFPADLAEPAGAPGLVGAIRERFGRIDVLYYAPAPSEGFTPAAELDAATMRGWLDLYVLTPVELVRAVLPEMLDRGDGAVLVGQGSSAVRGQPFMSGIGPAMAAMRNYVYSLHGEMAGRGVYVGTLTVGAMIAGSAGYRRLLSGEFALPEGLNLPGASNPPGGSVPTEGSGPPAGSDRLEGAKPSEGLGRAAGSGLPEGMELPEGSSPSGSAKPSGGLSLPAGLGPLVGPELPAGPGLPEGLDLPAGSGLPAGPGVSAGSGQSASPGVSAGSEVSAGSGVAVVDPDVLAWVCWGLVSRRDRVEVVHPVPPGV